MQLPREVLPLLPVSVTTAAYCLSLKLQPGRVCGGNIKAYRSQQELEAWLTDTEERPQECVQSADFCNQVLRTEFTHTFICLDTLNPLATKGLASWLKRIKAAGGQLGRLVILRRLTNASLLRKVTETTLRRRLRKLMTSLLPDPELSLLRALSPAKSAANFSCYQYIAERVADGSIKRFLPIPPATQEGQRSLNKQLVDHAVFFAVWPSETTPSPLHKLMDNIPASQSEAGLELKQVLVSKKDKLIVFLEAKMPLIGKITLSERARADAQQNTAVLISLRHQTKLLTPVVLQENVIDGYFYSIETECSGQPLKTLKDAHMEQEVMLGVLNAFSRLSNDPSSQDAGPLIDAMLDKSYHQLEGLLSTAQLSVIKSYFQQNLSKHIIPCGVVHHDLSQSNVLFNAAEQPVAVIDWDESTLQAPLALNLLSYLFSRCSRQASNQRDAFAMVLNANTASSELSELTNQSYQLLQSPSALHPFWTRLHWLITLAHQVQFEGFTTRAHLSADAGKIVDEFFSIEANSGSLQIQADLSQTSILAN
ncbi:Phosphotransferase enzyme family protein [Alkalimonas amylolytica]|uniref:Phosphotransferase enzyme family protein n=1 Tax=Alkalimonas amylolytica TaxID=152573 RepID=A0A1H4CCR7_ALKAM|nr:Phosphotransferase enzyme family protein [Alkalimonas amylolytica]